MAWPASVRVCARDEGEAMFTSCWVLYGGRAQHSNSRRLGILLWAVVAASGSSPSALLQKVFLLLYKLIQLKGKNETLLENIGACEWNVCVTDRAIIMHGLTDGVVSFSVIWLLPFFSLFYFFLFL